MYNVLIIIKDKNSVFAENDKIETMLKNDLFLRALKGESVERPYLGLSMYNLSDIVLRGEIPVEDGVYIDKVEKNTPADDAGLKEGDIIVKFDDTEIQNVALLKYQLYKHTVGDKVTISYYRGNDLKTTEVKLTKTN